ncbi:LysR family transcriptional regulator substrate-binding protein [Bacillus sp. JCM 19041]|uniref:LysR family transcriptional regulator substrate-binding protein n=1 Tax=Bacillus sp. JCM 19041 TaxID=1460637 RepID=UPI000B208BC9
MEQEIRETGNGLRGTLKLGAVKSCFAYLPERMKSFHDLYPDVRFSLRQGDSYLISELVKTREVEIGLVRMPLNLDDFESLQLEKEPFIVAFPATYNYSGGSTIDIAELAKMPLLLLHRISGTGQYELILDAFSTQNLAPHILCECPDVSMLLSLVSSGLGATIVPESTLLAFQTPNIATATIKGAKLEASSALIWLKDRYLSKAARKFIDEVVTQ